MTWRFQTRPLSHFGPRDLLRVLPQVPACLLDGLQLEGRRVALVAWHPRWHLEAEPGDAALARLAQTALTAGSETTPAASLLTGCCSVVGYGRLGTQAVGEAARIWALQPRCAALFDPAAGKLHLAAADDAAQLLLHRELERAEEVGPPPNPPLALTAADVVPSLDRDGYMAAVAAAQAEMVAGRLQKVVLASRFAVPARVDPLVTLERLAATQPLLLYLYREDDFTLVGAAPEWLVGRAGARVWMHPLAGTRALAGSTLAARRAELLASAKDVGEHLRAVDLCEQDLAPVCRPGSLQVVQRLAVEQHGPLCHLASRVEGELRRGVTNDQLLTACFPSGTVAGVPRAAAMEFIARHEPVPRGLYAGAVGNFVAGGDLQLFLPIRSVCFAGGQAAVYAGAGIMPDSDPAAEFAEIRHKAGAGLRALGVTDWLQGGGGGGAGPSGD